MPASIRLEARSRPTSCRLNRSGCRANWRNALSALTHACRASRLRQFGAHPSRTPRQRAPRRSRCSRRQVRAHISVVAALCGLLTGTGLLQAHSLRADASYVPQPTAGAANCSTVMPVRVLVWALGTRPRRYTRGRRWVGASSSCRASYAATDGLVAEVCSWCCSRVCRADSLRRVEQRARAWRGHGCPRPYGRCACEPRADRETKLWESWRGVAALDAGQVHSLHQHPS
jgi:hypothetical protein